MKTLQNVDLGKSFDKLKKSLIENTKSVAKNGSAEKYASAFGSLEMAVKTHLIECTDIQGDELYKELDDENDDPNDLKDIL